jgi:hypothetical protein
MFSTHVIARAVLPLVKKLPSLYSLLLFASYSYEPSDCNTVLLHRSAAEIRISFWSRLSPSRASSNSSRLKGFAMNRTCRSMLLVALEGHANTDSPLKVI